MEATHGFRGATRRAFLPSSSLFSPLPSFKLRACPQPTCASGLYPNSEHSPGRARGPSGQRRTQKRTWRKPRKTAVPMHSPSMARALGLLCLLVLSAIATASGKKHRGVSYDGRSLIINGRRELIFSGSVHYTRSTPDMWPSIIRKAKQGGLNTIETYVFWNAHEPAPGQYNFEGNYDLVKFVKLIQANGMYAIVRIGPFIQAEWNHGGFPYWLREVQNVTFRTYNPPYMYHMQKFTEFIVNKMKSEKLFAPQGGPIILSQIENEYSMVQPAYREDGLKYIQWAAKMATDTQIGVPWTMCKQKETPPQVIRTCNGRNCGDTFIGPNSPTMPIMWTENWTAQYRVFGDPPSQRSAEDLAYSVARFFSKNGTLQNYYMYHGGTNFGRTGAAFVMTRYYDEAPLDEYGLEKEPKWGHLRDLHRALRLSRKALLRGSYSLEILGPGLEARVYAVPGTQICAAFLTNSNPKVDTTATFRGVNYFLPRHSISILSDCKTLVFNTQRVNAQHNSRTFQVSKDANKKDNWHMFQERIPKVRRKAHRAREPLELMSMTKDKTDYLWYTTSFKLEDEDLPRRHDIRPVIQVQSLGHAMHIFVNGKYIGSGHGTKIERSFVYQRAIRLKAGVNHISILGMTVGFPDNGAYLEHRVAGLQTVTIQGLNTGTLDLTYNGWSHKVGMTGEMLQIYTPDGVPRVKWSKATKASPVTWYKRYFDAPHGRDPVAIDMSTMGKGLVWINGQGIGRYWVSYHSPLGEPSQSLYHVPRSFLKPKDNLVVVLEEHGGDPSGITVVTVRRDTICTLVSAYHPAQASAEGKIRSAVDVKPRAHLKCSSGKVIQSITFASFGNPTGMCGNFTVGNCHAWQAKIIAEKVCVGKKSCVLPVSNEAYRADTNCAGNLGMLAVEAKCGRRRRYIA